MKRRDCTAEDHPPIPRSVITRGDPVFLVVFFVSGTAVRAPREYLPSHLGGGGVCTTSLSTDRL